MVNAGCVNPRRLTAPSPSGSSRDWVTALRRRLGGQFTVAELARLYLADGTDWCFEIAVRVAPRRRPRGT